MTRGAPAVGAPNDDARDTRSAEDGWAGSVIDGRFEVAGVLGRGGMGIVLRARHRFTGAEVALKVLHPHLRTRDDIAERFLAEARAITAIGHPGIVAVRDAGVSAEGHLFLVMDLYEGETLGSRIAVTHLGLPDVRRVCLEVLDALGAAHAAGFVHRDLKPDNVFLLGARPAGAGSAIAPGSVRLLDFGIAKHVDAGPGAGLTSSGVVMGTAAYMSPEQLRNAKHVDHRSDLWALGVVLYEMATGGLPFVAEGFGEMLLTVLQRAPAPLDGHLIDPPPELALVLRRALAVDPAARFASASEMSAAIAALPSAPLHRREAPRAGVHGAESTVPLSLPAPESGPRSGPAIPRGLAPFAPPMPAPAAMGASSATPRRRRWLAVALVAVGLVAVAGGVAFLSVSPAVPADLYAGRSSMPIRIGDPASRVEQMYGARARPRDDSTGASTGRHDEPHETYDAMLHLDDRGIWFFFGGGKVKSIRLEAPFEGTIDGVKVGDTRDALLERKGKPMRPVFEFRGSDAHVYGSGTPAFVRYDVSRATGRVVTLFL